MKFFFAFVVLVAVASASPLNKPIDPVAAQIEAILAAIAHPSTDPATAELLMQQLESILNQDSPISVDPVIIEDEVPEVAEEVAPVSPSNSPLVQVIINVSPNVAGNPVVVEKPSEIEPSPVIVVEKPEEAADSVIVSPILIPTPVIVVDKPEQSPEPVIIAPIEVIPVPETLN